MSINDSIIRQVFDEMVVIKPKLAKYLPDGDGDEDFDIRELADQVVKGFPLPIGVDLERLFTVEMNKPDRGRLDQILRILERTMQFTSFVMLSQLLEERITGKNQLPSEFTTQFTKRFSTLTMGNYAWLIRNIGDIFVKNKEEPFIPELTNIFNNKFYKKLDFWVPERNDVGHFQINLTTEEIEKRCFEYQEKLTDILSNLAFFIKYPLVTITDIRVLKRKRKKARYRHEIKTLRGASSNLSNEECCDEFSDNHSVLLLKTLKNPPNAYLNLSPLIIDTHTEVLNKEEQFNILKDIFLYTKWQNERLHYLGTKATVKCDLRPLSCYGLLVEEFKEFLEVFGEKKGRTIE